MTCGLMHARLIPRSGKKDLRDGIVPICAKQGSPTTQVRRNFSVEYLSNQRSDLMGTGADESHTASEKDHTIPMAYSLYCQQAFPPLFLQQYSPICGRKIANGPEQPEMERPAAIPYEAGC